MTAPRQPRHGPPPAIRKPEFDFDIPRYWHGGSLRPTHVANAINFVFPAGERFFIRSVRHYLPQIADPGLRARAEAFIGQEAQHQRAHLAAFAALERHGFEIRSFLEWYERVAYGKIEPATPPILRLSVTAALEHFTATFGELALSTELLEPTHPAMQRMLRWHAAEEIEHRDVAYDVLQQVNPGYTVRMIGFVMAICLILTFWRIGYGHLMRQEPDRPERRDDVGRARIRAFWSAHGPTFARRLLSYLRPGFHPDQAQTDHLAAEWLKSAAIT